MPQRPSPPASLRALEEMLPSGHLRTSGKERRRKDRTLGCWMPWWCFPFLWEYLHPFITATAPYSLLAGRPRCSCPASTLKVTLWCFCWNPLFLALYLVLHWCIYLFKLKNPWSDLTWPTVWEESITAFDPRGSWSPEDRSPFCHISVEWCPCKPLVSGAFLAPPASRLVCMSFPLLLTSFFSSSWPINQCINWFTTEAYLEHCLCLGDCSRHRKHVDTQFLSWSSSQTAVETDTQSNIGQHD